MSTSFYVVWQPNAGPPTVRHDFEYQAIAEAERLAGQNPGREFFVLHAVTCSKRVTVTTERLADQLPF